MEIELPVFGKIKLEKEDWEYKFGARKRKFQFDGLPIDLDVHFKKVEELKITEASAALNNLSKIHLIGTNAIQKDFEDGEVVNGYIKEWKEDIFIQIFEEAAFQKFIENTNKEKGMEERLLSLIRLVRIGIYSESEDSFITMDFAFGYDSEIGFRDDMLVVTLNTEWKVTGICTEG